MDRPLSLPAVDPQLPRDIDKQGIPHTITSAFAEDPVAVLIHQGPDLVQDIISNTTLETSPQVGNGELDPIRHLLQELVE
jgi:hypothetical protein